VAKSKSKAAKASFLKKPSVPMLAATAILLAAIITMAVFTFAGVSKTEQIARQAERYAGLGIKESPSFSNRSYQIDKFNKLTSCGNGAPWCASFVSQVIKDAGGDSRLKTCSTVELKKKYKSWHKVLAFKGNTSKLVRGDVLFRERPSNHGHVGVFIGYVMKYYQSERRSLPYKIKVVEGNTSCAAKDKNGCAKVRYYWMDGSRADYSTSGAEEGTYLWESILRY
jgi:hypothetical protein